MSRPQSGATDGAGTRGSMDPKKAIRLMPARWIVKAARRRTSGSPLTSKESYYATTPSPIELAWSPHPNAPVRAQGPLEVR